MSGVHSVASVEVDSARNGHSPFVSVVIVNYNGKRFLKKCLDSLQAQTYKNIEIILVDNGSSDGSVDLVKEDYPSVRIIENNENLGFAKANNIGIRASAGDLVATLNNDTEASREWVEALVSAVISDERLGMCASKMLFMKSPNVIDSAGVCISRSGACWYRGMFEHDSGQYGSVAEVFGPCAGAAIYKRKMLDEVGLFDEDFYAYMEDVDLAFRGRLAGWNCLYVPEAVVYHMHGGTAGYGSEFTVYYGNRNIIWNAVKNYPMTLLITSLPFIVGRNLGVIPYYMARGYSITILRSKIDAIKGIPVMLAKRRRVRQAGNGVNEFIKMWAELPKSRNGDMPGATSKDHNIGNVK